MTVDHDHLTRMLARLRLTASRDQLDGLLDEAARRALTLREALALLCEREIARKDERRIEMARSVAKFPVVRDLAGFDFAAQPSVDPRQIQCVRVIAAHHPLAGQLVAVVRRTRYQGEPHLVVERPDGGRQLLAARCVEPAAAIPRATAAPAPLVFTPGSLRLLAALVATLRSTPPPAPEARDAPRHRPIAAAPAAVEHLPARDPPAAGRAVDRPAAAADPDQPGAGTRAVGAVP